MEISSCQNHVRKIRRQVILCYCVDVICNCHSFLLRHELKHHSGWSNMCIQRILGGSQSGPPRVACWPRGKLLKQKRWEGRADMCLVVLGCLLVPKLSSSHWASVSASMKWGRCKMGVCVVRAVAASWRTQCESVFSSSLCNL